MSYPTTAGETTTLPEGDQNEAPTPGFGESLIPRLLPHHGLSQMGEPGGSPLTPRLQGTGPRAK